MYFVDVFMTRSLLQSLPRFYARLSLFKFNLLQISEDHHWTAIISVGYAGISVEIVQTLHISQI